MAAVAKRCVVTQSPSHVVYACVLRKTVACFTRSVAQAFKPCSADREFTLCATQLWNVATKQGKDMKNGEAAAAAAADAAAAAAVGTNVENPHNDSSMVAEAGQSGAQPSAIVPTNQPTKKAASDVNTPESRRRPASSPGAEGKRRAQSSTVSPGPRFRGRRQPDAAPGPQLKTLTLGSPSKVPDTADAFREAIETNLERSNGGSKAWNATTARRNRTSSTWRACSIQTSRRSTWTEASWR